MPPILCEVHVGSVIKKRRKRMAKKKHRKLLRKTRHQRRNKK
nr:AURKAIP1/COX24 domain-containing protein [Leifsonia soli]